LRQVLGTDYTKQAQRMIDHIKAQVINLCIVNHDSNQHGENENVRIQNLWDSLELLAALMIMK
jgi:acetylornithine deacetylase/succinyl-diaminopimelate desuccinylase-like protein